MGLGPSIVTYDASMIPNQGLKELIIRTAADMEKATGRKKLEAEENLRKGAKSCELHCLRSP